MQNLIINIDLKNNTEYKIDTKKLKLSLLNTLKKNNFTSDAELTIHFVDQKKILNLNKKWRNINKVTDVLSFSQTRITKQTPVQLGDIFICLDQANQQAEKFNHSIQKEIEFLASHGLKHLIGIHHKE